MTAYDSTIRRFSGFVNQIDEDYDRTTKATIDEMLAEAADLPAPTLPPGSIRHYECFEQGGQIIERLRQGCADRAKFLSRCPPILTRYEVIDDYDEHGPAALTIHEDAREAAYYGEDE